MSETRKFLCVSCPVGCALTVELEGREVIGVQGNICLRGLEYAKNEVANPLRVLTTTVRVKNAHLPVVPVRSRTPLPLEAAQVVVCELAHVELSAPVKIGDVVLADVCGTGVDIIASRSLN